MAFRSCERPSGYGEPKVITSHLKRAVLSLKRDRASRSAANTAATPPKLLIKQARLLQEPPAKSVPLVGVFVALDDVERVFNLDHKILLKGDSEKGEAQPPQPLFVEFASAKELLTRGRELTTQVGKLDGGILCVHGSPFELFTGTRKSIKIDDVSTEGLRRLLPHFFTPKAPIALAACSSALTDSWAELVSRAHAGRVTGLTCDCPIYLFEMTSQTHPDGVKVRLGFRVEGKDARYVDGKLLKLEKRRGPRGK